MRARACKTYILPVIAFLILSGCASSTFLSVDEISRIKSIVLTTVIENDEINTIDIGRIREREYSRPMGTRPSAAFGLLGFVLDPLIVEAKSAYRINSSVQGSMDSIKQSISGYDPQAVFGDLIARGMNDDFTEFEKPRTARAIDRTALNARTNADADVLLRIAYRYGIGTLEPKKPLPGIAANIAVENLHDGTTIASHTLTAHACEGQGHTLEDYAKDGGKIYKQCLEEAAERLGREVASSMF